MNPHLHTGILCPHCKAENDKRRAEELARSNAATRNHKPAFTPGQAEEIRQQAMEKLRSQVVEIQAPYSDGDEKSGQWIVKMKLSDGQRTWPHGRRFMTETEATAFYSELTAQNGG